MTPSVSVVCSVRDGARFLEPALRSVLTQSYRDFELIVIDDGSTDDTSEILERIAAEDPRVRTVHQPHAGLTRSLNTGLGLARGALVARQDADDISLPHRFADQVRFLQARPEHLVVGTRYETIDETGKVKRRHRPPLLDFRIRLQLLTANALAHSSVMFRREVILELGGYDESFTTAQDYELWCRVAMRGRLANLRRIGLQRRRHTESISSMHAEAQRAARDLIRDRYRRALRSFEGPPGLGHRLVRIIGSMSEGR